MTTTAPNNLTGLGVALVTPFTRSGELDVPSLVSLTRHVVGGGADFVVSLGSTGEAAMLAERERDEAIAVTLTHAERAAVLVGTGASSTAQTVAWTRRAAALGAHGALIVVPPYTRPTQAGIVAHFRAVADALPDFPVVAYNVPPRAGTNLLPGTVEQLWRLPNVVGLKESSGDLQQIGRIAADLPEGKLLFAGDDVLALPSIAVGAHGLVSVAGNVVPAAMKALVDAARHGNLPYARAAHRSLLPLFDALSAAPNPIPIKAAVALLGLAEAEPRLPLLAADDAVRGRLAAALNLLRSETLHV